jgi:hypothetical protein
MADTPAWKQVAALDFFWRRDGDARVELELIDHDANFSAVCTIWLSPNGDKNANRAEISNAFGQMVADHLFEKLGKK